MNGEAFGLGSKADIKGRLAELGHELHPQAIMQIVEPPPPGTPVGLVVLERVREGELPEYCTHGYATCVSCHQLCWLGHETERIVATHQAYPVCLQCAPKVAGDARPTGRVHDHRRAEGPH